MKKQFERKYLLLPLLLLTACNQATKGSAEEPVTVTNQRINVAATSKFSEEIHLSSIKSAPGGERKLRTVGQMIAIANSSDELTNNAVSWVALDNELVRSLGIHLNPNAPIGLAYGLTNINSSYQNQVHVGERVEIYRYGLRKNSIAGSVISVKKDMVIFSIQRGEDWYPGTNCQVEFPLIQKQAVALSPLSMLHEGLREFVLKEVAPGSYEPKEITVVNETKEEVYAVGDLLPNDRVIESGAILLKPLIHQITDANREASHVQ